MNRCSWQTSNSVFMFEQEVEKKNWWVVCFVSRKSGWESKIFGTIEGEMPTKQAIISNQAKEERKKKHL